MTENRAAVLECVEDGLLRLANGAKIPVVVGACDKHTKVTMDSVMPVSDGIITSCDDVHVKVLRDTGCSSAAIKTSLVKPNQFLDKEHLCVLIDGTVRRFPLAVVEVDTPYYVGKLEVMCMQKPIYDLVLGNIEGVRDSPDETWGKPRVEVTLSDMTSEPVVTSKDGTNEVTLEEKITLVPKIETGKGTFTSSGKLLKGDVTPCGEVTSTSTSTSVVGVMTRAQVRKEQMPLQPLKVRESIQDVVGRTELIKAQKEDPTLKKYWTRLENEERNHLKNRQSFYMKVKNGILYRVVMKPQGQVFGEVSQIMVPQCLKERVLQLGHESLMGGHMGMARTEERIVSVFWWKGVSADVQRYVKSCDVCQRMVHKGRVSRVNLGKMPIISEPFERVAVDLVGPLTPKSERGHRWILTVIDYGTRYPEAVPLKGISTEEVAEALLSVFSRVGFPKEVLSDQGGQFVSDLMNEVSRLISVKQIFSTAWHAQTNGLCEKMNGVLKSMLKKMCEERPQDWDRYLPAVLFAYREVPQESTGFSPFELLYGRQVRGPMQILKKMWTGENEESEERSVYQYVLELRERFERTCRIVRENLLCSQSKQKVQYDKKARHRTFEVGNKVLLLLPTKSNKLLLQWKGPYEVVERVGDVDYRIKIGSKVKMYHANMLKRYFERTEESSGVKSVEQSAVAIVEDEEVDEIGVVDDTELLEVDYGYGEKEESYLDVKVCEELTYAQKKQVRDLLEEFQDIFSEKPGTTDLIEHEIEVNDPRPVRVGQYPIPFAKQPVVEKEVESMLKAGIIEKTKSEYNAPIVIVKKKSGDNRFCLDFRKLNAVTKFDTEPMGNIEDIIAKLHGERYFSKFDLTKGYWQIPMAKNSKHLTAFSTPTASYCFVKMPFGTVNSGATFNRMMRILLGGLRNTDHYVDDVLSHTSTWEAHLGEIRQVFHRIRQAHLTVRPTKCMIGYSSVGFAGHKVGLDKIEMEQDKVEKVRLAPRPQTKKQVRSFLGLSGYYRDHIKDYATVAVPLTDLIKKGSPEKVIWGTAQEEAFTTLKAKLTQMPILRMPDHNLSFILRTDASTVGVGAVLLQKFPDGIFPIAYASKKLLPRERKYAITELECLAIVFGVKKFAKYLYGKEFILQTDHAPLAYLMNAKLQNARCLRWALYLQTFRFRIEVIRGRDCIGADFMSRIDIEN